VLLIEQQPNMQFLTFCLLIKANTATGNQSMRRTLC